MNKPEKSPNKSLLVQFRADEQLHNQLSTMAEHLHMPIGALTRLWVAERLEKELWIDSSFINDWLLNRYKIANDIIRSMRPGPYLLIHLSALMRGQKIELSEAENVKSLLAPVERVPEYQSRCNLDGFQTSKIFERDKASGQYAGILQLFRGAQLESIRDLIHDEDNVLYGAQLDSDIVHAVWSYCGAMQALQVKAPVTVFVGFKQIKGFCIRWPENAISEPFDRDEFRVIPVTIRSWNIVGKIDSTAKLLKESLDQLANAAGLLRSPSFTKSGAWAPDGPATIRRSALMQVTTIDLSGIGRGYDRLDLLIYTKEKPKIIGKVRRPHVEPMANSNFNCRVYQDEMENGTKALLERAANSDEVYEFSVGTLVFRGKVRRLFQGLAAGAYDGTNIPHEKLLAFEVIPEHEI